MWIKRTALLCTAAAMLCAAGPAAPALALNKPSLQKKITAALAHVGNQTGALVTDLTTRETLYASRADVLRIPASVEKLYTTSTALIRFGPTARLSTTLLASGSIDASGVLTGNLILRGGGDPTLSGNEINTLAQAAATAGIKRIKGAVIGDESRFDPRRGGPNSSWSPDGYIGGSLGGLVVDRGSSDYANPGLAGAKALAAALNRRHISRSVQTQLGLTPRGARVLNVLRSPTMASLIQQTNTPSDNFLAEMLLKNIGASFGGSGTTPAGARVVQSLLSGLQIHPQISDGSGLSSADRTSPRQVVALFAAMHASAQPAAFENSLAIAGQTGTLAGRMSGTAADGRCHGKTGTLSSVSSLVGICHAPNGHLIAFAMLMNGVTPDRVHGPQDKVAEAIAQYSGP